MNETSRSVVERHATVLHGWYSAKQRSVAGLVLYATPTGTTVRITEITADPGKPVGGWDDYVYVGFVTRFLDELEPPSIR